MKTWELVKMAWKALGVNKLRSILTTSGITIGIFSIISVMTAIAALQTSIETGLTFLGANTFQFSKYPTGINVWGDEKFRNRRSIDYQTYLKFVRLIGDQVEVICPKVWDDSTQGVFENRKTNPNIQLCGTTRDFLAANNYKIGEGRNLSGEDVEFSRSVCVVGQQLVQRLFPQGHAVGATIKLNEKNYEVIGTLAEKGSSFGGNDDNLVVIPIPKFFENYGSKERSLNIAIVANNQMVYERTMGIAIGAFRVARNLRPEDANNFEIYSNDSLANAFRSIAATVRVGAFIVSAIALVAAGVGIMNIMLVSVTERTKEIGIRKSLGARQRDIRIQFLLEAVFLSLLGATAGIVLGVVAGNGLALWLQAEVVFPFGWAIVGVVVCSAIGVGFGLYPAHKAASLDPIEALRFE
ncbi:MAG: putative transport system permease protein [Verrucomicrobiota bacterium]|jgi:putative ABC transport system permease protein|nr:putative transport system permease protein [Verrucomicrobiota bacterium]